MKYLCLFTSNVSEFIFITISNQKDAYLLKLLMYVDNDDADVSLCKT